MPIKRLLKVAVGCLLIFASLGWYGYERFAMVSGEAFTVGFLVEYKAPADGTLDHRLHRFEVIAAGSQLASLEQSNDTPEQLALRADLDASREGTGALRELIETSEGFYSQASRRQSQLRGRRHEQLSHLSSEAGTRVAEAEAEFDGQQEAGARAETLCRENLMTGLQCDDVRRRVEVARQRLESAKKEESLAAFLLRSDEQGLDVAQAFGSDITYSQQFANELKLRLAGLKQDLADRLGKEKALAARVSMPKIPLGANVRLLVWSVARAPGSLVNRGELLFQALQCNDTRVLVTLARDKYEHLSIGQSVEIEIADKTFAGHVEQLLGSLSTYYGGMVPVPAAAVGSSDTRTRMVVVGFDSTADSEALCRPGITAQVRFRPTVSQGKADARTIFERLSSL